MRPYLLFSNIILLISLLFYCQYVKEPISCWLLGTGCWLKNNLQLATSN